MPNQNQISISDVDNIKLFDKQAWDNTIPIQAIANDPILQSPIVNVLGSCLLDGGGSYATTTFTKRVSGGWEMPLPKTDLNVDGIGQLQDSYVAIYRAKSWGQEEIARDLVGADLLKAVEAVSTQFWSDNYQKHILNMLHGIFEGPLKTTHQEDASAYNMNWAVVAAAMSRLGDQSKKLATIIMHSAQLNSLKQHGLVKYYNAGELGYDIWTKGTIPTINGLWIVETDTVPVTEINDVKYYHAYIGGQGVIEFRNISFNNRYNWDTKAAGTDYLIQSAKVMARVPGVKFLRTQVSNEVYFSDADIGNPLNWQKVAESDKDIPLIELITKGDSLLDELLPPVPPDEPPDNGNGGGS